MSIRIAVISDIHVAGDSSSEKQDSWISVSTGEDNSMNPFTSLIELIDDQSLRADVLICCGDMANKASLAGQKYAWSKIQEVGEKLQAQIVVGTAGNHDLDSRYLGSDYDAKGGLLSLQPPFPGRGRTYCNEYWANNYAIETLQEKRLRLLNINSCAFHGYGKDATKEFEHGRISDLTLRNIERSLTIDHDWTNVGFFHHHPMRWDGIDHEDYEDMRGGSKLLQLLSDSQFGSWLVIHGHRHYPNLAYAYGGGNSPVVLSAGSFSSKGLETGARHNEFYIVELLTDSLERLEMSLAGTVNTWRWSVGGNWRAAKFGSGIPSSAGFGNRETPIVVARAVHNHILSVDEPFHKWSDITNAIPSLKYVLPNDLVQVLSILSDNFGYEIMYDQSGWPSQLQGQTASEVQS